MDRYEIQKGEEDPGKEPLPPEKRRSSSFPEYIEDTKVLICFNPDEAKWYIKVTAPTTKVVGFHES